MIKKGSFLLFLFVAFATSSAIAQCESWENSDLKSDALDAYTVYNDFLKANQPAKAFPYWKKAYDIAPGGTGKSAGVLLDGAIIHKGMWSATEDAAQKKEYADMALKLFDQAVECYPKETSYALGRKVYDMFYSYQTPYSQVLADAQKAVEAGGNSTEYIVFQPYATIVVYEVANENMDKETARAAYEKLMGIADFNIANNKTYSEYYQQAKDAMVATFEPIESIIFDCAFFKNKYEARYRENPNDYDVIKEVYSSLVGKGGCPETDPLVAEMKGTYEKLVGAENARRQEEFYATNPGAHANALLKEGNHTEALAKFELAVQETTDSEQLGYYYLKMATINYRNLDQYSKARSLALKAADARPNWGKPYLLIGDMYAGSAGSCGSNAFENGLAVLAALDKYYTARNVDSDPDVQSEASKRISRFAGSKPEQGEAFMMGVSEGDVKKVPCWIGESVKVSFR